MSASTLSEKGLAAAKDNRARAKRWFEEVWNQRRVATLHELFGENGIGHTENGDQGRDAFAAARELILDAFPDLRLTVEDVVAEGDHVVVRWAAKGTHRGNGLGMAATNRPVSFRGMTWLIFRDGRIVEGWDSWNLGGLFQSLSPPAV